MCIVCTSNFNLATYRVSLLHVGLMSDKYYHGIKRKEDAASVLETHSAHLLPYNLEPTRRKFSRRSACGGEEPFLIHDSITDLWVVPETNLTLTGTKHQNISASHRNSEPPSSGTITADRCLTLIQDAAHSESGWALKCETTSRMLVSHVISLRHKCFNAKECCGISVGHTKYTNESFLRVLGVHRLERKSETSWTRSPPVCFDGHE